MSTTPPEDTPAPPEPPPPPQAPPPQGTSPHASLGQMLPPSSPQFLPVYGPNIASTATLRLAVQVLAALYAATLALAAGLSFPVRDSIQAWLDAGALTEAPYTAYDLVEGLSVFVLLAAGVTTVVWLVRARRNAEAISLRRHERSRVWLWWIVSLWFPFQVSATSTSDRLRRSSGDHRVSGSTGSAGPGAGLAQPGLRRA